MSGGVEGEETLLMLQRMEGGKTSLHIFTKKTYLKSVALNVSCQCQH